MITTTFAFGNDIRNIIIRDNELYFCEIQNNHISTISGLKLDRAGVFREHPDLKDNKAWKEIAIKRFKKKFKSITGETKKNRYIIDELTKFGWKALMKQRAGHRPEKIR